MWGKNKYRPSREYPQRRLRHRPEMMSSSKHVFDVPGRVDERKPSISQEMSVLGYLWKIDRLAVCIKHGQDLIWILRDGEFKSALRP
jgi:hypothetical protein